MSDDWKRIDELKHVIPREEMLLYCGSVRRIGYFDPVYKKWIAQNGRTVLSPTHVADLKPVPGRVGLGVHG